MGNVVAVDIGTSGIRGKLLDADSGRTVRTCITTRNPIPGANVMDHMSFAMEFGVDLAHGVLLSAVHDVVRRLKADGIERLALCGNPIQLSLFEGIDIRDLAFAGENKLRNEGIAPLDRRGHSFDGDRLGFPGTEIIVPPAVKHEIGADALAMMLKSGFLDDDMCMVTDYGTNAEMALKVGDDIYTGSAAAGPAMEGQQIRCGMVAGPGAVSDLVRTPSGWRAMVLDDDLMPQEGPMINLRSDITRPGGLDPVGITGTGVVAMVYTGLQDERIEDARIRNEPIRISRRGSVLLNNVPLAFGRPIMSFRAQDLLTGLAAAVMTRLFVSLKGKNKRKYRTGAEYGSARWGTPRDIAPFIDPVYENNILLTATERLTMNGRPALPKYARNKNVMIVGGSGSGKTRFYVKPNLMQMPDKVSYVVTDPKGTLIVECGKMLKKGGYRVKVVNTINFAKSMRYNPFHYIHSEKDILKLVNALIANTKGEGERSTEDFWVKAERLLFTALIGYIMEEAPEEEQNFPMLVDQCL